MQVHYMKTSAVTAVLDDSRLVKNCTIAVVVVVFFLIFMVTTKFNGFLCLNFQGTKSQNRYRVNHGESAYAEFWQTTTTVAKNKKNVLTLHHIGRGHVNKDLKIVSATIWPIRKVPVSNDKIFFVEKNSSNSDC